MDELHPWTSHPLRGPKNGSYPSMSSPRSFGAKPQKVAFHKVTQKALSLFTTTFFSVWLNWKYLCGLRTFPVPTKMIFNAFRNNSGFSDFHLRNASEVAPAAPEHFRFLSQKIPKSFQNDSGILQELSGMCRNQFDLMVYPKTTFRYHRNLSDDLSLWYDSAVRNFSVSETFSVIFSQTPCLVFSR